MNQKPLMIALLIYSILTLFGHLVILYYLGQAPWIEETFAAKFTGLSLTTGPIILITTILVTLFGVSKIDN